MWLTLELMVMGIYSFYEETGDEDGISNNKNRKTV